MTEMWELRERMLSLAAHIGAGSQEPISSTIARANAFCRYVYTGGWDVIYNEDGTMEFLSSNVMEPWQAPLIMEIKK